MKYTQESKSNINDIDNIAYKLYKIYYCEKYYVEKDSIIKIDLFIRYRPYFFYFYDKAEKILRKNKLEKINNL